MITLYHGSNQTIDRVDLSKGKRQKDFGQGFYTTHLIDQARQWAVKIAERYGGDATVTEFAFDLEGAVSDGLNVKIFENPTSEWAEFVMYNRKNIASQHSYDIVIGPVANDNISRLFGLYDMDIIDLDMLMTGLIYKELNSQYFFATERALKYLKKV